MTSVYAAMPAFRITVKSSSRVLRAIKGSLLTGEQGTWAQTPSRCLPTGTGAASRICWPLSWPIVSSLVTVHVHWLRAFPLTLHFLSLFVVAALGGFWPALIACFTTLGSRGYFEHIGYDPRHPLLCRQVPQRLSSALHDHHRGRLRAPPWAPSGRSPKPTVSWRTATAKPHRDPQQHQVRLLDHRPRQRPERPLVSRQL